VVEVDRCVAWNQSLLRTENKDILRVEAYEHSRQALKIDSLLFGCIVLSIKRVPKMDRLLQYIPVSILT
jgi:hypothetical protein